MRHKFEKSLDLEISAAYNLYSTWVRETTRNNLIFCDLSYALYGVSHCEKQGGPNLIAPEACGRHDRETVTQVDGQ